MESLSCGYCSFLGESGPLEAFQGFAETAPGMGLMETAMCGGCCWRREGWDQAPFPALLQTKGTSFLQFILELSHL